MEVFYFMRKVKQLIISLVMAAMLAVTLFSTVIANVSI